MLTRLSRRPWGRELVLFGLAYLLYSAGRFVAIGDLDVATDNAQWIVRLEEALSVDVERSVQDGLHGS